MKDELRMPMTAASTALAQRVAGTGQQVFALQRLQA